MASRFTLPHIEISRFKQNHEYASSGAGGNPGDRIRAEHGRRLQGELSAALKLAEELRPKDERLPAATTTILEVELRRGTDPEKLDRVRDNIRSSAAKANDRNDRTIAIFVPDGSKEVFSRILSDYLEGDVSPDTGNPPNMGLVEAIDNFRAARLETVWTDDPAALPTDPQHQMWWALWCWPDAEEKVEQACERLKVRAANKDRRLYFPDITVVPVLATRAAIELMLFMTGAIAELRRATDNPVFFLDDVKGDQHPWTDDLAGRITWPGNDAPAVCMFDTGVNRGHSLIEPALAVKDQHAVDAAWGVDDPTDGHGTAMAGMILHGDLTAPLGDGSERTLTHRLESVKLLPPNGFDPNDPASYGVITQAAVALPEITAPERSRVFCMAVTNLDVSGSVPSGWSAAIDQAASGSMPGDDANAPKRLLIVSTGNISAETDYTKIKSQDDHPIEDPAQAWNALTVGGYTDLIAVRDKGYENWTPMVAAGALSPHSRTSATWPQGRTPFKPEIVMEAGNRAVNATKTEALTVYSLSLLSTGNDATRAPLVPFQATSAAAAQAARLGARLTADHPEFWPETIRGLIVHSADWTQPMLDAFAGTDGKKQNYELVRRFGYGVPDYERATASTNNHLALFAQAEIQPFKFEGRRFNECHYYELPIPAGMLERLENEPIELKVTLSYFVEPNPGLSANVEPQRYQSHGLRFDLRRKGESLAKFKSRVNTAEPAAAGAVVADDDRWLLGPNSVSAGSLHCDVWSGPAIDLLGRDILCIKPVYGWWRDRAGREYPNKQTRYALIVTLKAQNVEVDLYTPIKAVVDIPAAEVETRI